MSPRHTNWLFAALLVLVGPDRFLADRPRPGCAPAQEEVGRE
jgi:hypothetical protein